MDHQLRCMHAAQRVLTLTSIEREGMLDFGLMPQRVEVIGGGVNPWKKTIDKAVPTEAYQLATPYILFIGRVSFEKGAIHAAEAVRQLQRKGAKVVLALVGHIAPEFERYLSDLPAEEQAWIKPLGSVSEADKQALLDGAELLVLPSRTDSFGIVILEAWSHGKAVIGANAGGIPGVIDDKTNGLLVEFGDVDGLATAVAALLADETWRHTLGQNGRLKTETEYTWSRVATRVIGHYEQLTGIT
jgi:glycosyltransferase involved in cell wall biosynthesis